MDDTKHILIVGGGITGLTAAYYMQKSVREQGLPYTISLIEGSERLGGKIQTELVDGFVIEKGPDSFLARKQAIIDLTLELGLVDQLVGTNPKARKNYIFYRNRLHLMPPGLILGIPTQMGPFVKTGLISPMGKLRAALDLLIPSRKEEGDEALGAFLQRRLGKEVAENIAEPLLSGIYAGDTQVLSLDATFPQFKAIETKYGSIIKGMLMSRKAGVGAQTPALNLPAVAKQSMFLNYKNGLGTLVNKLITALDGVHIHTKLSVNQIIRDEKQYRVIMADQREVKADSIILATPAYVTKSLLRDMESSQLLANTTYVSVANVVLAFNRADLDYPLDASGFVIPRNEGRSMTACTWTSSKWTHSSPSDKVLLRCYVGHSKDQSKVNLSDGEMVAMVQKEIKEIMGVTANPIFYRITRWENSMPQYQVGHLQRLKQIRQDLAAFRPGVFLAGAGYQGVGIPDCIQQGKDAVQQVMEYVSAVETKKAPV